MRNVEPADDAPFEWWEEVQLAILASIGEDVSRFRAHPAEWRVMRRKLHALRLEEEKSRHA